MVAADSALLRRSGPSDIVSTVESGGPLGLTEAAAGVPGPSRIHEIEREREI